MGGLLVCKQEVFFLLKKSQRESGILHWNESEALKSDLYFTLGQARVFYPFIRFLFSGKWALDYDTRDGPFASEAVSIVLCGRATKARQV